MTTVDLTLSLPDFARAAERLNREIPGLVAATLQTNRGMIFNTEGKYNDRPGWAKLKCRDGMPLKDRGTLAQSIGPRNDGLRPGRDVGTILRMEGGLEGMVTVGTSLAYAAVQNAGATIVPVRARALAFRCHGKLVFRRKVKIPARPFNDWTQADSDELTQTVENYVAHVLGAL